MSRLKAVRRHWVVLSVVAWVGAVTASYLIPDGATYAYALMWAGGVTVVAATFTVGYIRYSKPSKDPETGARSWSAEWYWFLAQGSNVLLVIGCTFVLRLMNADTAVYTAERVAQYRGTAVVYITSFFIQAWLLFLWGRAQVRSRRALRANSR